jgi:hypothetical protein
MSTPKKDKLKAAEKGFENLLGVHMYALEENSQSLVEILELLKDRELSAKDKNALKKIGREIKAVDKKIDSLGKAPSIKVEKEEEDWFPF